MGTTTTGASSLTPGPVSEPQLHFLTILGPATAARLLIIWFAIDRFPHGWLYTRGIELGILAQSIVDGKGLSSPFGGSTGPTALLSPGYPAFIAVFFGLFGSFTFGAAIAVMIAQVLFSVTTVLVIMRVALRAFGIRAAKIAGAFWALSLPLLWMPTIFWETCLSTLLLVGMVALALRCARWPSLPLWAAMGAYCGAAALINPALLTALVAMLGWAAWQTRTSSRTWPMASLLALLLVFAPWPIRNARLLHAFIPLRSTVGLELWMGNRPGATGFLDQSHFPTFNRREFDKYVAMGEVTYMRDKTARAKLYMRAHPEEFLRLTLVRFVRFWVGSGSRDGSAVFVFHAALTTSLGFLGLFHLFRQRRFGLAVLFMLPLMLFPVPYYITHAEFRYRLVVDPLLTILGGYAVSLMAGRFGAAQFDLGATEATMPRSAPNIETPVIAARAGASRL